MLKMVFGLYRAIEEGMAYSRIGEQYANDPQEMVRRITAVMLDFHGAPAPASVELPATEMLEEVAGRAA